MSEAPPSSKQGSGSKVTNALLAAAISLALAVVVVAIINKLIGIEDSVMVVAILLIPLLVYGVVSGKITEFTGPGGWGAKFAETTSKTIQASDLITSGSIPVLSPTDAEAVPKADRTIMEKEIIDRLPESGGPRALTMRLGLSIYDEGEVASVIEKLNKLPNFKFVVFIAEDDRFVAYAPPQALIKKTLIHSALDPHRVAEEKKPNGIADTPTSPMQAIQQSGEELPDETYDTKTITDIKRQNANDDLKTLITAIRDSKVSEIKNYPGMCTKTVRINATNAEALEIMESVNQDAGVVVDDEYRFKGVIERGRILSHIMVELARRREGS
jgi:hypothetical protein